VLAHDLQTTARAIRRTTTTLNRLLAKKARHDMRSWQVQRRARTRTLIELGGLVVKAGLVDLTDDDRAVIFGALLAAAGTLSGDKRDDALARWKQRGADAFAADAQGREEEGVNDNAPTPRPQRTTSA
jgi:hypothetical protein